MDSPDGINWTQRSRILYFEGFALPIAGEIAVTETHFYLTVQTDVFGSPNNISLYGDDSQIESDSFGRTNVLTLNGDFFGKGPIYSNTPCTFTNILRSSETDFSYPFWDNLPGYLDIRTTSDDLLIGQNGISRKDGQIYYGNWASLGEIKGYHNGVGLILTEPETSPKLYLSRDFLRTWTEEDLPGSQPTGHLDATFFKDQWFVLSASGATSGLYSFPVEPVTYQIQGKAQLKAQYYDDQVFTIPGCKDNLTTNLGIQLTFPEEAEKLFQVYTSTDLQNWTAYGLPFPGSTTQDFPIISGQGNPRKIFFRAEEISIIDPQN